MTTFLTTRPEGTSSGRLSLMGALTSIMLHLGVLLTLATVSMPTPADPSPTGIDKEDEARERLVVILPSPEPESQHPPAARTPEPATDTESTSERSSAPAPRQYAAAPAAVTVDTDDLAETLAPPQQMTAVSLREVSTPLLAAPAAPVSVPDLATRLPHLDPYLQRAVAVRQDGVRAPQYRVSAISITDVWRLVHAGLGRVVIAHRPFTSDFFAVEWSSETEFSVRPLMPDMLKYLSREGWASRALQLSGATAHPLTQALEQTFGVPANATATFLMVTDALDALVLAEQLRACEAQGVPCEQVALTRGWFVWDGDTLTGYHIDSLDHRPAG